MKYLDLIPLVIIPLISFVNPQRATVTRWGPCPSTLTAPPATPPTETASANLEWAEPTATGAWLDTGASTTTAAARAIARETVIHLQETVCLGECRASSSFLNPRI